MKLGKVAGKSGILPEMVRAACCDSDVFRALLAMIHSVWEEGKVPKDWADAIMLLFQKKEILRSCDNWRGIDVVGKVVARIL